MDQKLAVTSLVIFIVIIFAFAGTMGWYVIFKENVCKVNLNSPACFESYSAFLRLELNRI